MGQHWSQMPCFLETIIVPPIIAPNRHWDIILHRFIQRVKVIFKLWELLIKVQRDLHLVCIVIVFDLTNEHRVKFWKWNVEKRQFCPLKNICVPMLTIIRLKFDRSKHIGRKYLSTRKCFVFRLHKYTFWQCLMYLKF